MSKALDYLSIARKAGALEIGELNAGSCIREGKGRLLVLASDASDNARSRAEGFIRGKPVPLTVLPMTKDEISSATGKAGCSMAVFTEIGLAERFASALCAEYGEAYGPLAEELGVRLRRAQERRREALAHERNRKFGKRRNNI